jgi:hypothetical protein
MDITFEFACQDDCLDKMIPADLRELVSERDTIRMLLTEAQQKLADMEGQEALYVVLDTNTGRPESEFVEIENSKGASCEVFSVMDAAGFRRIGPLYTKPQPLVVPDLMRDSDYTEYVPPEDGAAAQYYVDGWNDCREAMQELVDQAQELDMGYNHNHGQLLKASEGDSD